MQLIHDDASFTFKKKIQKAQIIGDEIKVILKRSLSLCQVVLRLKKVFYKA